MYLYPWFWYLGPTYMLKYTNTGITQPPDCLYTWVVLHLMWNVEFDTEWLFVYVWPWFGIFGPNLPNLPQFSKYTKTVITSPSNGFYPWVKFQLMWNVEFNTLNDHLCIDAHDLGYLSVMSLIFLSSANTQKKV